MTFKLPWAISNHILFAYNSSLLPVHVRNHPGYQRLFMLVFLGFNQVFIVTRNFSLGPKMCRPTACPEASRRKRRTREKKPLVPMAA